MSYRTVSSNKPFLLSFKCWFGKLQVVPLGRVIGSSEAIQRHFGTQY